MESAVKCDFKAAGKASKENKDATTRVKECQEELTGEAVERKEPAEKKLKEREEEFVGIMKDYPGAGKGIRHCRNEETG